METSGVIGAVHHRGIAVDDIGEAKRQYEALGYGITFSSMCDEPVLIDKERNIRVIFLRKETDVIELVTPVESGKKSPVDRYIACRGGYSVYHTAYNVGNMEEAIAYLKNIGYSQIENISTATLIDDRREVYMYSRRMGLVELLEEK